MISFLCRGRKQDGGILSNPNLRKKPFDKSKQEQKPGKNTGLNLHSLIIPVMKAKTGPPDHKFTI